MGEGGLVQEAVFLEEADCGFAELVERGAVAGWFAAGEGGAGS